MKKILTRTLNSQLYALLLVLSILLSVFIFVLSQLYPNAASSYNTFLLVAELTISSLFTLDYFTRIFISERKLRYIFSLAGLIDLLSSVPHLIAFVLGLSGQTSWIRLLRIVSLGRIFRGFRLNATLGGIFSEVLPYSLFALGVKSLVIILETKEWWIIGNQFNLVLGVVGFSLAVLMGAKISTVNGRLYALEDTICRLVGGMRDMWSIENVRIDLINWSTKLEAFLKASYSDRKLMANDIRRATDNLEISLKENGIGGPNSAGFHRDAAFLIHRATVKTPPAYDNFLRTITIFYIGSLIIGIQGGMGVLSSFLSSLVLGGVYFLVQDLDDPLGNRSSSYIDARLDALEFWNESKSI